MKKPLEPKNPAEPQLPPVQRGPSGIPAPREGDRIGPLIEAREVHHSFGSTEALRGADLG